MYSNVHDIDGLIIQQFELTKPKNVLMIEWYALKCPTLNNCKKDKSKMQMRDGH